MFYFSENINSPSQNGVMIVFFFVFFSFIAAQDASWFMSDYNEKESMQNLFNSIQ